jgi:arabinan endo-1,5-alpha-L-arabinosidase
LFRTVTAMKFLSLLALAGSALAQYAGPGECKGDCWAHDPGFYQRVSDGRYFRFSTGNGIHIHASNQLTGPWEAVGEALPGGSSVDHPGSGNLWVRLLAFVCLFFGSCFRPWFCLRS